MASFLSIGKWHFLGAGIIVKLLCAPQNGKRQFFGVKGYLKKTNLKKKCAKILPENKCSRALTKRPRKFLRSFLETQFSVVMSVLKI